MVIRIPYPIPIADRMRLMEAGRHAIEAMSRDMPTLWQKRHAKVELVIAELQAKYGVEEQEKE